MILAAVTYLGAMLRIGGIGESLWLDELHTAWAVSGSLAEIPGRAAIGNYSPLYFFLVWAVTRVAGFSEIALRFLSLVPGILLVPLGYLAVVKWTRSRAAGLVTAWLLALDMTCVEFAQEARPYALIQCLALVHVLLFWQLLSRPGGRQRVAWIVLGVLLFYLHYTALGLVLAQLAAYCVLWSVPRWRPAYRPVWLALDLGLLVLACLPATHHLLEIAARRDNWRQFVVQQRWPEVLSRYPFPLALYVYLPLVLAGLAMGGRRLAGRSPLAATPDWRLVIWLVCWYVVPVGGAWIATNTDLARLLFPRYVIVASLVPLLAAGVICSTGAGRWSRVGLAALVGAVVVGAEWNGHHRGPVRPFLARGHCSTRGSEDWRGVVTFLDSLPDHREDPVLLQPGLIEADALTETDDGRLIAYCLFPVTTSIYPLDTKSRRVYPLRNRQPVVADPRVLDAIIERGGAWLVVRGRANKTLPWLAQLLAARGGRICNVREKPFVGILVMHLDVEVTAARPQDP